MKKILITGFDPFENEAINPAFEAVKGLGDEILGVTIIKEEIPTVSYKAIERVIELIDKHKPDAVINVGQAGGRFGITPEKVAINLNDFRIKDNEGNQPLDTKIVESGENAYFTTLPVKAMVANMKKASIPASLSYSAGTFVCNQVMYGVLNYIAVNKLNIKSGFIHIPFMTEQVIDKQNKPSLSLAQLTYGLEVAIKTIIETKEDIKDVSGEIC